jgi:hypothetical protein
VLVGPGRAQGRRRGGAPMTNNSIERFMNDLEEDLTSREHGRNTPWWRDEITSWEALDADGAYSVTLTDGTVIHVEVSW